MQARSYGQVPQGVYRQRLCLLRTLQKFAPGVQNFAGPVMDANAIMLDSALILDLSSCPLIDTRRCPLTAINTQVDIDDSIGFLRPAQLEF